MDQEQDIHPQIYLVTPSQFELDPFCAQLQHCFDAAPIACLRLSMVETDQAQITRTADRLRDLTHERDIALVIDTHIQLVEPLGLDGVHLPYSPAVLKNARTLLGEDAIVGAFCKQSRHDGISAGEIGADYVSFGPVGESVLGDGTQVEKELFEWWSMMIEVPVVAEGYLNEAHISQFAPHTDFFALGDEVWRAQSPTQALVNFHNAMTT